MEQQLHTLAFCFFLVCICCDVVTSSPTPDANLLCISECGTCPVICSPPPRPVESKPPPSPPLESKTPPSPPIESKSPPSSTPVDSEPPPYLTPIYHATPPQSNAPPTTPPPSPRTKSCPPPSYITMGTNAPPPPPRLVVVPSTQIPAGGSIGQKNYSYPYYYFYASKGVSFSSLEFSGFLILSFQIIFLFFG